MGVKFIHTADLHLGSNLHFKFDQEINYNNKFGNPVLDSFKRITVTALKENVDFIIIAGDLFDSDERSVKALKIFNSEARKLKKADIPIYLIAGNHDPIKNKNSLFALSSNVKIFDSENSEIKEFRKNNKLKARLIGQSYRGNSDSRKMYSYFKAPDTAVFNIALLHTQLDPNNNNYVPCSLENLRERNKIDYWALGHIHQNKVINANKPVIVYPGIPQGRDFGEKGKKGFYLVELTENKKPKLNFINSSKYIWQEINLKISENKAIKTADEIVEYIFSKTKEFFIGKNFNYILRFNLVINSINSTIINQKNEEIEEFIIDELNNSFDFDNKIWVEECNIVFKEKIPAKEKLQDEDEIFSKIINLRKEILNDEELFLELKEDLGDIWQGDNDLEKLDEFRFNINKEIEEITEKAETEILKKMWEKRGE